MDKSSVFAVFSIVIEWGAIVIDCPNFLFETKVNNTLDATWLFLFTKIQWTKAILTDSNFGMSSLNFYPDQSLFFVFPNNFIASGDNNSNL